MRLSKILGGLALTMIVLGFVVMAHRPSNISTSASLATTASGVPRYNHIFVVMEENHGYGQIIGNSAAPTINSLAKTYGLATHYTGVADPSEPNYVALIGGSFYGIADDNPYYTHTITNPSLVDQLEGAGLTWKGYFQSMPYPGFMGICFPTRCGGTPDSDTLYASKHNGFPNFARIQNNVQEQKKMVPDTQLDQDLQNNQLSNFSLIVPDECHDMHGSPPNCTDSANPGTAQDNLLVSVGDTYLKAVVNKITSSAMWSTGNNAIVITWDEGNTAQSRIVTIVIANHGPRGLQDSTSYSHYSLLLTIEQAFGLGCLQNSCSATVKPMAPLFAVSR